MRHGMSLSMVRARCGAALLRNAGNANQVCTWIRMHPSYAGETHAVPPALDPEVRCGAGSRHGDSSRQVKLW